MNMNKIFSFLEGIDYVQVIGWMLIIVTIILLLDVQGII